MLGSMQHCTLTHVSCRSAYEAHPRPTVGEARAVTRLMNTIVIGRPVEDVFRVLTNVENTGKWFPAKVEEHWTSAPPHGVGSTRHAVVTMLGRRTENNAVATVYDPPHRAAMQGTSPNAPFVTTKPWER